MKKSNRVFLKILITVWMISLLTAFVVLKTGLSVRCPNRSQPHLERPIKDKIIVPAQVS